MLLRFSVVNHLSVRDRAEISFVATSLKELQAALLSSRYTPHGVLPVIALYGANASGKSNVLHALGRLRTLVVHSFTRRIEEGKGILYNPFRLDDSSQSKPTELEIDFVFHDTRYQFGVHLNSQGVLREWLYRFPKSHRQILYYRDENAQDIHFGRQLTGALRQIESITRKNCLFISAAKQSGHSLLSDISEYFRNNINIQNSLNNIPGQAVADVLHSKPEIQKAVIEHVTLADTGIQNLKIETVPVPERERNSFNEIMKALEKFVGNDQAPFIAPETKNQLLLGHACSDGSIRYLDFNEESLGTRYLLTLLPPMVECLQRGGILVLDEITTSLHTLLARHLIGLFHDKNINTTNAQLLFTTHDTNQLNQSILRRDEIWLVNKNRDGSSVVESLSDTRTKNTDNLEKGYLDGRFGGIPYIEKKGA